MNQTIVSIDLETRGRNPATCAIASIGVVIVNPVGGLNPSWLLIGDNNTPMFVPGTETATFRRAAS